MAPDSPTIKSIYDFIYLDREKLGSISAQIFDHGLLLSSKYLAQNSHGSTESSSTGADVSGGVSLPGIAKGGIKVSGTASGSEQITGTEGIEHSYDSYYVAPINLLNKLDELKLIKSGLLDAEYGQIVLIQGSFCLKDVSLINDIWIPISRRFFTEAVNLHVSTGDPLVEDPELQLSNLNNLAPVIAAMSKCVACFFRTEDYSVWSTLKREFLTVNPTDFIIKNSENVPGMWFCLGILDTKPADSALFKYGPGFPLNSSLKEVRDVLGVSDESYGVTPIAIFRKIA